MIIVRLFISPGPGLARRLGRISQAPGIELVKLLTKIVGPEVPFSILFSVVYNLWLARLVEFSSIPRNGEVVDAPFRADH